MVKVVYIVIPLIVCGIILLFAYHQWRSRASLELEARRDGSRLSHIQLFHKLASSILTHCAVRLMLLKFELKLFETQMRRIAYFEGNYLVATKHRIFITQCLRKTNEI